MNNKFIYHTTIKKVLCFLIILSILFPCLIREKVENVYGYSITKTMTLTNAKRLALNKSSKYKEIKSEIELLKVKYTQAVKTIQLKQKNMATFRWTPLLSFKFPEKPNLSESYEFTYKPLQIQSDITAKQHELTDYVYEIYEKLQLLYVKLYVYQEKIQYNTTKKTNLEKDIVRNKARVLTGEAKQSDIDKMQAALDKINSDLSTVSRNYESSKKELTDMIKVDVTSGYKFSNPMVTANITRDKLETLTTRTLDKDQEYYESKLATTLALTSINTYEKLMKEQYGGNLNIIQSYINQGKNRQDIDYEQFKKAYEKMQQTVDAPWAGKLRILFIRIPKIWFKGQISGVRYIEDEPFALITATKEYISAANEQDSISKSKTKEVEDGFNNLINLYNAYASLKSSSDVLEKEYTRLLAQNKLGQVEYEEVSSSQTEYENMQMDILDALASYTEALYSYDRLTCGGITAILNGEDMDSSTLEGGDSIIIDQGDEGATYTIKSQIENSIFVLNVSIPEEFTPDITHFELWIDGVQIGERTEISKSIKHLALDLQECNSVFIRFYNDEEFVDDCIIDQTVYHDKLSIKNGYLPAKETTITAGTYDIKTIEETNLVELSIVPKVETIKYYKILTKNNVVLKEDKLIDINEKFTYLSILKDSLADLQIIFYGEDKEELYSCKFNTDEMNILAQISE